MQDYKFNTNATVTINGIGTGQISSITGDIVQKTTISDLTDGGNIQDTDNLVAQRGTSNYKIAGDKFLKNVLTTNGDMIYRNSSGVQARLPAGANNTVVRYVGGQPTTANLDDLYAKTSSNILYVRTLADLPTPINTGDGNGLAYHISQQVIKFINTPASPLVIPYTIVGDNGLVVNCDSREFVSYAGAAGTSMFKVATGKGLSFGQSFFQTITSIDGVPRSFCEGGVFSSLTCRAVTLIDFNKTFYNNTIVTYCQLEGVAIRDNSIAGGPGVSVAEGILINGFSSASSKFVAKTIDMQFANILTGTDKSFLKLTGGFQGVEINTLSCAPGNGESAVYLSENLQYVGISISACAVKPKNGTTGVPLHPNSLTQKELGISVSASPDGAIPNSTSTFEMAFQANTTQTAIATINTPTPLGNIIVTCDKTYTERLVFQDTITSFNSTTNIITMPFAHGLVANDIVFFNTYTGTLPTGILLQKKYYVIPDTTTTFKISETLSGPELDFTTNGTGTLYLQRYNGNSISGWVINIGGESIFHIDGLSSFQPSGAVEGTFRRTLMFSNATTGNITTLNNGFGSSLFIDTAGTIITSGSSQTSKDVNLKTGEGVLLYVERLSGTGNVIIANQITNFTKK